MVKEYKGKVSPYFETGMEGVRWALETEVADPELMHQHILFIKEGDKVTITSKDDSILFDDVIVFDKLSCRYGYPSGMGFQQVAGGFYTHWIQHGFNGDEWCELFSNENSITVVRGSDSWERVKEIKETVDIYRKKQSLASLIINEGSIDVPVEKPERINSGVGYYNDIDDNKIPFYSDDKFDLETYQALLINLKATSCVQEDIEYVFVKTDEPLNDNVVHTFDMSSPVFEFEELVSSEPVSPLQPWMFEVENDDYFKRTTDVYEKILEQYQKNKPFWKTLCFDLGSRKEYAVILKVEI